MKEKLLKKIVVLAMALFMLTPVFAVALPVQAVTTGWGEAANNADVNSIGNTIGLGNRDPRAIAASVINVILGFLGIIAVVIILLGGFKWMTGGGNEDKVGEAKKLIIAGVVGLVIILASWGIATFVIDNLLTATGIPPTT
ncbi:MAG: pilin [Patescibacteria group bacterium]|nr:pilin [Patescibacteria group bacterium]